MIDPGHIVHHVGGDESSGSHPGVSSHALGPESRLGLLFCFPSIFRICLIVYLPGLPSLRPFQVSVLPGHC